MTVTAALKARVLELAGSGQMARDIVKSIAADHPHTTISTVKGVIRRAQADGELRGLHDARLEHIITPALALARQVGVSAAARQLNRPRRTIQRWREKYDDRPARRHATQ